MQHIDRVTIGKQARDIGYVRDTFEKVCRLINVLDNVQNDSLLSEKLALKGGTAINLTILNIPRLSVDIDMDFVENLSRDDMLNEREQITERIMKYMESGNYNLSQQSKRYHALDSFIFEYRNTGGSKDNIKIEINYMNRTHVLPTVQRQVNIPWLGNDLYVLSVDPLEIFGSKIVALLNRAAPRDLYDVYSMFQYGIFDNTQYTLLKKCTMFYSAIGSVNVPQQFSFDNISSISQYKIKTDLIPVLKKGSWFDVQKVRKIVVDGLKEILIPTDRELLFWKAFQNKEYCPEFLFDDEDILERVRQHPMALWKCSDR